MLMRMMQIRGVPMAVTEINVYVFMGMPSGNRRIVNMIMVQIIMAATSSNIMAIVHGTSCRASGQTKHKEFFRLFA